MKIESSVIVSHQVPAHGGGGRASKDALADLLAPDGGRGQARAAPRDLVRVDEGKSPPPAARPADQAGPSRALPADDDERRFDVRRMSPREMSGLSMELYMEGVLDYEEYSMLAFQPELHPDFDKTIGALTGEAAQPDLPRDFVRKWEERLAFERRYGSHDSATIRRAERIVAVLLMLDAPTDMVA